MGQPFLDIYLCGAFYYAKCSNCQRVWQCSDGEAARLMAEQLVAEHRECLPPEERLEIEAWITT